MKRFRAHFLAASCGFLVLWSAPPALGGNFEIVRVASGLSQPVYVTAPQNDPSRLFIVEANSGLFGVGPNIARIKILNLTGPSAGTVNSTPFLEISGIPQVEDQGLFGLAFHPNYADNGFFYVNYAIGEDGGESRVVRYKVSDSNPNVADPASATPILSYYKPFFNHSGDWLGFSPNDVAEGKYYLYHTTGDGGSNSDPMNHVQRLDNVYGKVLRLDVGADGQADAFPFDSATNYAIPPENPFVSTPGANPAVFHYGLRNPWRASFDRETGDLYIGNVGANRADEVEFQPGDSPGGINFGWSRYEGTLPGPNPNPPITGDQKPLYQKIRNGNFFTGPDRSVTGGYVYRGPIEELQGHYIFADFLGNYNFSTVNPQGKAQIFSFQYDGSAPSTFNGSNIIDDLVINRTIEFTPVEGEINFISSFGEDALGNLYIVDLGNLGTPRSFNANVGEIYMLRAFPVVVPEPSTWLLAVVGIVVLLLVRRRAAHRASSAGE
jgi:glucose/arabinose dehydrogenase